MKGLEIKSRKSPTLAAFPWLCANLEAHSLPPKSSAVHSWCFPPIPYFLCAGNENSRLIFPWGILCPWKAGRIKENLRPGLEVNSIAQPSPGLIAAEGFWLHFYLHVGWEEPQKWGLETQLVFDNLTCEIAQTWSSSFGWGGREVKKSKRKWLCLEQRLF